MPELPEVETTKEGIKAHLEGQVIHCVEVHHSGFRIPVPADLPRLCKNKKIRSITRRAKYILIELTEGYLLIHLGMSGHLRVVPQETPLQKHDHINLILENKKSLRFCDPRRFGLFLYLKESPQQHQLLLHLGPEPLSDAFNADYLYQKTRHKNKAIKSFIMDNQFVVGVGNIYATESLFCSRIHPETPAQKLTHRACQELTQSIKTILQQAIKQGGTTLKDFYASDGKPGYFSVSLQVYGRQQQPCFHCQTPLASKIIGGRNSSFCPNCQKLIK